MSKVSVDAMRKDADYLSAFNSGPMSGVAERLLAAVEVLEELLNEPWTEDEDYHYAQERVAEKFVALQERITP